MRYIIHTISISIVCAAVFFALAVDVSAARYGGAEAIPAHMRAEALRDRVLLLREQLAADQSSESSAAASSSARVRVKTVVNGEVITDIDKVATSGVVHIQDTQQAGGATVRTNTRAEATRGARAHATHDTSVRASAGDATGTEGAGTVRVPVYRMPSAAMGVGSMPPASNNQAALPNVADQPPVGRTEKTLTALGARITNLLHTYVIPFFLFNTD